MYGPDERIERVLSNQSLLDLSQQLQALQTDVRTLRAQLEELQHSSTGVKDQQRNLYADLDKRLQALEAGGVAAAGATAAGASGALPMPAGSDRMNYQAAFELLKSGQYEKATTAFQQFLVTFPDSALADNAQYWLGESYYAQRDFTQALAEFRTVIETYPRGNKVPDALLKVGYCYQALGQSQKARAVLEQVVTLYPKSEPAALASRRLGEIQ